MNIPEIFFCSHVLSRLLLGFGLLFMAMTATSMLVALPLIVLAAVTLRLLDGGWQTSLRLLRLLRWFVFPILLLHLLFTPGQLLFPGFPIGMSREGLMQGLWLSIHLTNIYTMAILMFRLLRNSEWLRLLAWIPRYGERIMVPTLMMMSMKQHMSHLLSNLRQQFFLRHDWKMMPLLLMAAFRQALADAVTHAQMLWLRWPQQFAITTDVHKNSLPKRHSILFSTVFAACGSVSLLTPWLT